MIHSDQSRNRAIALSGSSRQALRATPSSNSLNLSCTMSASVATISTDSTTTKTSPRRGGRGGSRGSRGHRGSRPGSTPRKSQNDPTPAESTDAADTPATPTPSTTSESKPTTVVENTSATSQDDDTGTCFICAEPVKYYSVPECNHRTCHVCALRLRALYKRQDCTLCKVRLCLACRNEFELTNNFFHSPIGTPIFLDLHDISHHVVCIVRTERYPL
jgi:hypothetical protein